MSELDRWLQREPTDPAEKATDPWLRMAVSDPTAWRKKGNPHTDRIAQMIADDAMLPRDGQVGKHVWGVAVSVMEELQSPEIAEEAIQECRRTKANWRKLSIWIMRSEIQFAGRRLKARRRFVSQLDEDPIIELEPLDEGLLRWWGELRAEIVGKTERGFYNTWLPPDEPETLRDEGETLIVGVPNEGAAKQCNVEVAELGMSGRVQFVARAGIEAFREADGG